MFTNFSNNGRQANNEPVSARFGHIVPENVKDKNSKLMSYLDDMDFMNVSESMNSTDDIGHQIDKLNTVLKRKIQDQMREFNPDDKTNNIERKTVLENDFKQKSMSSESNSEKSSGKKSKT